MDCRTKICSILLIFLASAASHAATVATSASASGTNFVTNGCASAIPSGSTVEGCLNGQPNAEFQITTSNALDPLTISGGQATLDAGDGTINSGATLTLSFTNGSGFTALVINIDALADGSVTFGGTKVGGGSISFTPSNPFALGQNGANFFTITASPGEVFQTISLTSTVNIADISQIRVAPVPVPAAAWLLGSALLGLAGMRRRS